MVLLNWTELGTKPFWFDIMQLIPYVAPKGGILLAAPVDYHLED